MTIHQHHHPYKTIHDFHSHSHYGWDNALTPIAEVDPGETVTYAITESSGGQFNQHSTPEDVKAIDFDKVKPVAGPIDVKGAEPGDTLEVEMLDVRQLDWGWAAIIPGFGLLADDIKEPAIRTFDFTKRAHTVVRDRIATVLK